MSDTFRIQRLRQFLIAAESGSFRAAASGTSRSAAAVSTAMRDLELQVGAPLFEKGHRARLTPLGETLTPLFAELLRRHDRVVNDVHQLAKAERGSLSVAVAPFLAEEWFPAILRRFLVSHPDIAIKVTDERSRHIRRLVAEGAADIGIATKVVDDPKLTFNPIAADTYGVACRCDHPIASRKTPLTWNQLTGERLIGNDGFETLIGHGLGEWIENPVISVSSRTSVMDCVRQGVGITILPRLTKPAVAEDIVFVPLVKPKVTRQVGILTRAGQTLLPAARDMYDLIEAELRVYAKTHGATLVKGKGKTSDSPKGMRGRKTSR
ncbi:MAG TPA: LysR family transcriptional regulator [Pseudolabrys sp.]